MQSSICFPTFWLRIISGYPVVYEPLAIKTLGQFKIILKENRCHILVSKQKCSFHER